MRIILIISLMVIGINPARAASCQNLLAGWVQKSGLLKVYSYLTRPKYIEDHVDISQNEIRYIQKFLESLEIGYDIEDASDAIGQKWHGIWSPFKDNLWDIKYSDHPSLYDLENLVAAPPPRDSACRRFAAKALHRKADPAPIAYVIAWERLQAHYVDWAVHILVISGGDYWVYGKSKGTRKTTLAAKVR